MMTINDELLILAAERADDRANTAADAIEEEAWLDALYRSLADPRNFGDDYDCRLDMLNWEA